MRICSYRKDCDLSAYRVPHKSPLLKSTNDMIRSMLESGLFEFTYARAREMALAISPPKSLVSPFEPVRRRVDGLNMNAVKEVYYLLAAGIMVSVLVFAVEVFWWNYKRRQAAHRRAERKKLFAFVM